MAGRGRISRVSANQRSTVRDLAKIAVEAPTLFGDSEFTQVLGACHLESDVATLIKLFRETIKKFGFTASAGGSWIGEAGNRRTRFYFNDWPQAWMDLYQKTIDFEDDPCVIEAKRRLSPFLWSDIRDNNRATPRGKLLIDAFETFGWREVFCVPIHGPFGYGGLVSLASTRMVKLDLSRRAGLEMISLAVLRRCREAPEFADALAPDNALTKRQIECLRWAAVGMSDAEIGAVLKLGMTTVHYHIEEAKRRLKVSSRAQAVALLLLNGKL